MSEEERKKAREGREEEWSGFVSYLIKSLYELMVIITACNEAMVLFYSAEQLPFKFIY